MNMVTDNTIVVTIVHDVQVCNIEYTIILYNLNNNLNDNIQPQNKKRCIPSLRLLVTVTVNISRKKEA